VFVLKNMARKQPDRVEAALSAQVPVVTLRNDSLERLSEALLELFGRASASGKPGTRESSESDGVREASHNTVTTS
jgi:hypothetical protein